MTYPSQYKGSFPSLFGGGYGGTGGDQLRVFQDRCTRETGSIFNATEVNFVENQLLRFLGTDNKTINISDLQMAPKGSRLIVFNHDGANITVQGSRNVSVEQTFEMPTTSPYLEIIVNTEDTNLQFKNVVIIASE